MISAYVNSLTQAFLTPSRALGYFFYISLNFNRNLNQNYGTKFNFHNFGAKSCKTAFLHF